MASALTSALQASNCALSCEDDSVKLNAKAVFPAKITILTSSSARNQVERRKPAQDHWKFCFCVAYFCRKSNFIAPCDSLVFQSSFGSLSRMKVLLGVRADRFIASILLVGVFTVAGHHFAIVASAEQIVAVAAHQDVQSHPDQEHQSPNSTVEAHAPTPIIQKFQLQKQLQTIATVSNNSVFGTDSPDREIATAVPSTKHLPARLPSDLKTVFLN